MVPHLIKAQSAYKNIRIHLLHTPRHHHPLHTYMHTHTQSFAYMQQYYIQELSVSTVWMHNDNVSVILKSVII